MGPERGLHCDVGVVCVAEEEGAVGEAEEGGDYCAVEREGEVWVS